MYYTIQKGSCVHSNLTRKEVKLRRNNSNDNCNSFYEPCLLQQQSLSACPEEDYCQNRGQCLLKSSVRFSQIEILNKRAIKTLQKYLEFSIFFKFVKFQGWIYHISCFRIYIICSFQTSALFLYFYGFVACSLHKIIFREPDLRNSPHHHILYQNTVSRDVIGKNREIKTVNIGLREA